MSLSELLGRFFFQRSHPWIFLCLLSAPFCLVSICLSLRLIALSALEQSFDSTALRGRSALEKRALKERFLHRYSHFESYFINQHLESLILLHRELEELHLFKQHPACSNREAVLRRIALLESAENRLSFAEENTRSSPRVKETEERLIHSVEIDQDDLDRLLSLIEGIPIGEHLPHPRSPYLFIKEFLLSKKAANTYEMNLNLIKREFLSPHEKN